MQIQFISVIVNNNHRILNSYPLKLKLYQGGIYTPQERGRIPSLKEASKQSHAFGIIQADMPIGLTDIAYSPQVSNIIKATDQFSFDPNARWIKQHFTQLVHPFVASISGIMACELNLICFLTENRVDIYTNTADKIRTYFKLVTATSLFSFGGHSLYEFYAPFTLDVVRKAYQHIPLFEHISIPSMFHYNNTVAFQTALDRTRAYNRIYLAEKESQILAQISPEPKQSVLITPHPPVLNQQPMARFGFLAGTHPKIQSPRISSQPDMGGVQSPRQVAVAQVTPRTVNHMPYQPGVVPLQSPRFFRPEMPTGAPVYYVRSHGAWK